MLASHTAVIKRRTRVCDEHGPKVTHAQGISIAQHIGVRLRRGNERHDCAQPALYCTYIVSAVRVSCYQKSRGMVAPVERMPVRPRTSFAHALLGSTESPAAPIRRACRSAERSPSGAGADASARVVVGVPWTVKEPGLSSCLRNVLISCRIQLANDTS